MKRFTLMTDTGTAKIKYLEQENEDYQYEIDGMKDRARELERMICRNEKEIAKGKLHIRNASSLYNRVRTHNGIYKYKKIC